MKVTLEKVDGFDLKNLVGYDATEEVLAANEACIVGSTCIWVGRADGIDVCAFGLVPFGCVFTDRAYLWLIWTRFCEQHPLRFIRWGKRALVEMKKEYPKIVGLCRCDSPSSQAWLKWLGAEFDPVPHKDCYKFRIE